MRVSGLLTTFLLASAVAWAMLVAACVQAWPVPDTEREPMFSLACFAVPVVFALVASCIGFWKLKDKGLTKRTLAAVLCLGLFAVAYWFEFIYVIIPVYFKAGGGI